MSAPGPSGPLVFFIVLNVRNKVESKYPSIVFLSTYRLLTSCPYNRVVCILFKLCRGNKAVLK